MPPATTPEALRAEAERLERDVAAARARGDAHAMAVAAHQAHICRLAADELEALLHDADPKRVDQTLRNDEDTAMTTAQLARRGRAVARARADNPLLLAISGDPRWGSAAVYAKKRLKVHPSSLTRYMRGDIPPPVEVDKKVRADFPGISWRWPKSPVQ